MQDTLAPAREGKRIATRLLTVSVSAVILADASRIYGILADYRNGHPRILPPQFTDLTVERGGVGEGTIVRFHMRMMGRTQTFRAAITEPDPGRTLVETYLDPNGTVTTFRVDSLDGDSARVTIATTLETRGGLLGPVERFVTTRLLRPIYMEELKILARVAGGVS
jgi:hypothetical protein